MKVSICMITYNHEKYIKQAIDSILMQKCNFDYEIVIGEDASTDKTRNIIIELKKQFPKKIKLFLRDKNIGMLNNFVDVLQKAKGKYIALLEGDDYWTDPYKLQKQVDFLEANPDYVLCHHDSLFLDEIGSGKTGVRLLKDDKEFDSDTKDLLIKNRASTLTVMFRNNLITNFPDWYFNAVIGDWPLYILLSQFGKLKYLPFIGAVYRVHKTSITSAKRETNITLRRNNVVKIYFGYIDLYKEYLLLFPDYESVINNQINHYYYLIFKYYFALRNFKDAKNLLKEKYVLWRTMKTFKDKLKYLILFLH